MTNRNVRILAVKKIIGRFQKWYFSMTVAHVSNQFSEECFTRFFFGRLARLYEIDDMIV